jgi:hypothetical protein
MKTNINHFAAFAFSAASKRPVYFAMSEGGPKPPEQKAAPKEGPKEAGTGQPDLTKMEARQKLYADAQAKIDELRAKGDKVSNTRADSLERALKMARENEGDPIELPETVAGRLYSRLDRILHPTTGPTPSAAELEQARKDLAQIEAGQKPAVAAGAPPKVEAAKEAPQRNAKLPPGMPKDVADQIFQTLDNQPTGQYASGNVRVKFKYEGKDYVAVKIFGAGKPRYEITPGSAAA